MSVMVMCSPVALNCSKSWAWSATSRSNFSVPSAVVNSHSPKASPMMTSSVSAPLSSSIFKNAMNSSSKSRIFSCSSPPMCRSLTKKYSSGISGPLLLGWRYLASLVRCPYRGRPFRGRMVNLRVQLGARQHDRCREVEVDEQPYGRPEAPVGHAVVGEVRQVDGETDGSDRPGDHGERRAQHHGPQGLPGGRDVTVDDRERHPEQREGDGEA